MRAECNDRNYLISTPIVSYYYTQMIGDPKNMPTIIGSSNFAGIALIGKISVACACLPTF